MEYWTNIEVSPQDPEIIVINQMAERIGIIPEEIRKIRQLISRFEVCHFKYRRHIKKIKDSIQALKPEVDAEMIGVNHIRNGETAWKNDPTGRSYLGQQYVWAIREWLLPEAEKPPEYNPETALKIRNWLGNKDVDKIRILQLLLARLTYDWQSYQELQRGGEYQELELQACRMDTCHYAFPSNLDRLLQAIGKMTAIGEDAFEGCGSFNLSIRNDLENEFSDLNGYLANLFSAGTTQKDTLIRIWLTASLAKTIKENLHLTTPVFLNRIKISEP